MTTRLEVLKNKRAAVDRTAIRLSGELHTLRALRASGRPTNASRVLRSILDLENALFDLKRVVSSMGSN